VICLLLGSATGECENRCNGNGACAQHDRCDCYQSWDFFADCSARTCPYGRVETASESSADLHPYSECSSRGSCDRATGLCVCMNGYSGHDCSRETCPANCNGKGQCVLSQLANAQLTDGAAFIYGRAATCVCDPGYEGVGCTLRTCPRGDDPLRCGAGGTPIDNVQTVTIVDGTIASPLTGSITGSFTMVFTDQYGAIHTTRPLDITKVSVIYIEEALVAFPGNIIPSVDVGITTNTPAAGVVEFTVTYSNAVNSGLQETLVLQIDDRSTAGSQPLFAGLTCGSGNCAQAVVQTIEGTPHSDKCSGRGNCDDESGTCLCFKGFNGLACSLQNTIA